MEYTKPIDTINWLFYLLLKNKKRASISEGSYAFTFFRAFSYPGDVENSAARRRRLSWICAHFR
jgi:hypothetical protein